MHVAIAGNIGAGKTTLTELLHKHYGWEALYEDVVENPYLDDFYAEMERCDKLAVAASKAPNKKQDKGYSTDGY